MGTAETTDTLVFSQAAPCADQPGPLAPSAFVEVDLAAETHTGKVRPNNEDHFLVTRFERSLQTLKTNLPPGFVPDRAGETGYSMLVADGMGGAAAGEVASQVAIRTLVELVLQTPDWIMQPEGVWCDEVMRRMSERFRKVDEVLAGMARENPKLSGMGTTMTLVASVGATLIIAHAGDSRAYLFRNDKLIRLTRDHTLAQTLEDGGMVSRASAAGHPFRNMLTRSIGRMGGKLEAEVGQMTLKSGDAILICSDGLTDMVAEDSIQEVLRQSLTAAESCRVLVQKALDGGGRDNVTVALARYHFPGHN